MSTAKFNFAINLDVTGADIREILDTDRHHRRIRPRPKLRAPLVISIQYSQAIAISRQILQQRSFFPGPRIRRPKIQRARARRW